MTDHLIPCCTGIIIWLLVLEISWGAKWIMWTDFSPKSTTQHLQCRCGVPCLEELTALTKVKRFSVAVMFLSKKQKQGMLISTPKDHHLYLIAKTSKPVWSYSSQSEARSSHVQAQSSQSEARLSQSEAWSYRFCFSLAWSLISCE